MKAAMMLAIWTGMRQQDLLCLTLPQCKEDGIHVEPKKTKRRPIFEWTPALREAVNRAKTTPRKIESMYLIVTRDGLRDGGSGFQTAWPRLMADGVQAGVITERFTFHDLRAKAGIRTGGYDAALGTPITSAAFTSASQMR